MSEDNTADQTDDERRKAGLSPVTSQPGQRAPKFVGPRAVNASFWLWIAGVTILVLSQVVYLLIQNQVAEVAVKNNTVKTLTADQIRSATHVQLWLAFIAAVVFGALLVLFAYKMREGTRSARTVVTILAVVTALFYFAIFASLFAVLAILLFVIAVVLVYLPSVQPYFPKVGRKL